MDSCECSVPAKSDTNGSKPKVIPDATLQAQASMAAACPTNGVVGKRVDLQTVKAMLSVPLNILTAESYRFCADPDCSTAYYSEDGEQIFGEDLLRECVYQKHADTEESTICYCFGHTVGSISHDIIQSGKSTAVEEITAGIKAGQCACDIRNPQGNCCLGNVRAFVKSFSNQP